MKQWLFLSLVVSLALTVVKPTSAQEPVRTPGTVITTPAPVATSGPIVTTQSYRPGLVGRIRARRSGTVNYVQPAPTVVTPTPARTSAMPMATPTTSESPIQQVQYVSPAPVVPTQVVSSEGVVLTPLPVESMPVRTGLFGRLRARR